MLALGGYVPFNATMRKDTLRGMAGSDGYEAPDEQNQQPQRGDEKDGTAFSPKSKMASGVEGVPSATATPRSKLRAGDLARAEMTPLQRAALEEAEQLAAGEARANALRAQYNALSFKAEEKQQELERLSEMERILEMQPASPEYAKRQQAMQSSRGSAAGTGAKSASARAATASETAAAAAAAALNGGDSTTTMGSATMSQLLGDNHPSVMLEHARLAVESRLGEALPELAAAEEYADTLHMMLDRVRDQHAHVQAGIGTLRDRDGVLDRETNELKLLAGEARKAAAAARVNTKEALAACNKNSATYAAKLAQRKREYEVAAKRTAKQERLAAERGTTGGGGGGGRRGSAAKKGGDLALEQQERLQRVLVATRMSSLVLLAQRDDNVEQVSRYEAAFKKMARAAGSNDAEVVITKFISRNETRASLLEERSAALKRRADLDAEQQRLSARLQEMQYSMVHPQQTESALRELDPKITVAHGRLELLTNRCGELKDLQLSAGAGAAALLARVASAAPFLGAAPDAELNLEASVSAKGEGGAGDAGAGNEGAGDEGAPSSAADAMAALETSLASGGEAAFEYKLLHLFKACEARLGRLDGYVEAYVANAEEQEGAVQGSARRRPSIDGLQGSTIQGSAQRRPSIDASADAASCSHSVLSTISSASTSPRGSRRGVKAPRGDLSEHLGKYNVRVSLPDGHTNAKADGPLVPRTAASKGAARPSSAVTDVAAHAWEEDDEESERAGYFGEERRRVKVGERPASARGSSTGHHVPAPPMGSMSARGAGTGPRGRRLNGRGQPQPTGRR